MKICNYCGTGMDNRAHKCPFCGQDMTVRGAIKYEDNLPFNGSMEVYSTKHLRKDPAVEDKKSWLAALSAKKTQYKKSTGATYDTAYTEGKQMQEKYAASQQEKETEKQRQKQRQRQTQRPKRQSKKSAKRSGIIAAVIAFFVAVSTMMAVCDDADNLDWALDSPFFYNNEIMNSGSLTDNAYNNAVYAVAITLPSDWTMSVPDLPSQDAVCFTDLEGSNADSTVRVTYAAESVDSFYESDYEADGFPTVYDSANSYLVSEKAELDATGNYATMEVETAQLNGKTIYLLHYSTAGQYFVQVAAETNVADVYVVIEFSSSNFYAINELLSHISFTD